MCGHIRYLRKITVGPKAIPVSPGLEGQHKLSHEGYNLLTAAKALPEEILHIKGSRIANESNTCFYVNIISMLYVKSVPNIKSVSVEPLVVERWSSCINGPGKVFDIDKTSLDHSRML